jgi:hypothetical protein
VTVYEARGGIPLPRSRPLDPTVINHPTGPPNVNERPGKLGETRMKVYISGPITGLTESEYTENFARAEAFVISEGHEAVNPVKVQACVTEDCFKPGDKVGAQSAVKDDGSYLHSWQCYMKHDLIAMFECDAILMIPGWESSRGAQLELDIATRLDFKVHELNRDYVTVLPRMEID